MRRKTCWLGHCLLTLWVCHALAAFANPLQELQAAGHLQISSTLTPETNIVPGQKLRLTLEIATDRWFAGGTRISIPEVPGLVMLQTEQFASNASENRGGQTWVIQRWTLDVFPQRAGDFAIPPMALQLKVNTGESGDVQGELYSPSTRFSAIIPPSLDQAEYWVAAPEFEVRQSFDRALENLQVGDAFEQEIVFEASDVMAMMLPAFTFAEQAGLAAYPSPPVLDNRSNRGQTKASRSVRISYMIEAEGLYTLPAQDFFWWDTARQELKLLSLPATEITAGHGSSATTQGANSSLNISRQQLLVLIAGLVFLAGFLGLIWKFLPRLPARQFAGTLSAQWRKLMALRKPALPDALNPGSSAGD